MPTPDPARTPGLGRLALYALGYALVLPVTMLIGHGAQALGIVATLPFIPVAGWLGGPGAVQALEGWLGETAAFYVGGTAAVFAQAYLCVVIWAARRCPSRG